MSARPPLVVERTGPVVTVRLDRPEFRNAFDEHLAERLRTTFEDLAVDDAARVVVLRGTGEYFCAGGDLAWMARTGRLPFDENLRDAQGFVAAYAALDRCPKPIVARVQGAAMGGGAGLVAVSDVAIAAQSTVLGFPEVRLGLVPAAISPYVVARIGWSQARRWFTSGERFDAATALRIGLVHEVVPDADLDAAVDRAVRGFLAVGPEALARTKRLLRGLNALAPDGALMDLTARTIAQARASTEAQEGLAAFLEKRPPTWTA